MVGGQQVPYINPHLEHRIPLMYTDHESAFNVSESPSSSERIPFEVQLGLSAHACGIFYMISIRGNRKSWGNDEDNRMTTSRIEKG
jgi:hypothetical protein